MMQLAFFLEEPSAREMLKGLMPKILPHSIELKYVVFEGKQDLEKRLHLRLREWKRPDTKFVVVRDQDNGDCVTMKRNLIEKCQAAGKSDTLVRIACRELEALYIGDLNAVAQAIGPKSLIRQQHKAKYRDPDRLSNPSLELKKLAPNYQKVSGSRAIGPLLDIDNNRSNSFNVLVAGVKKLMEVAI